MSNFKLNLPIDIPWKRICVTEDMIDRNVGDKLFPLRWQTSIAVFEYEPEEEYQNYEDMTVSYLKVACSITGFQPRGDEVGFQNSEAKHSLRDPVTGDYLIDRSRWSDTRVIQAYKDAIGNYYGCYGAILEVAVVPDANAAELKKIPSSKFPYFIDFEPKKRELYELVTETGERMSRSLSGLNVKKGTTTAESHEILDIFGGVSANVGYAGAEVGGSIQGQWGTKDLNQTEYVDMRTTDSAREKRESFSHTTQLSQMYHQLNSYHLGTNRATFYVLPRPHIAQLGSDNEKDDKEDWRTFVNGPRLLEGLQEFFLVVIRPNEIKSICVEAYLETAHIFQEKIPKFQEAKDLEDEFVVTGSLNEREGQTKKVKNQEEMIEFLDSVASTASGEELGNLAGDVVGTVIENFFGETTVTAISHRFTPESTELEFDMDRRSSANCTPKERENYISCEKVDASFNKNEIEFLGSVYSRQYKKNPFNPLSKTIEEIGKATIQVQVPQRYKEPELINGPKSLFLTGRGVKCCTSGKSPKYLPPSVVWENNLDIDKTYEGEIGKDLLIPKADANLIREKIAIQLYKSINDPNRKPRGKNYFGDTDFFTNTVSKILDDAPSDNVLATEVEGVSPSLQKILGAKASGLSRKDLLDVDIAQLMFSLDIEYDEAQELRRSLLGLVKAEEASESTYIEKKTTNVPNLIGLKLNEALGLLNKLGLNSGAINIQDSYKPKDVVLKQSSKVNKEVFLGSNIDIVMSTGPSVRIPDILNVLLTDALLMLRRAGYKGEPEISFVHSSDKKLENCIADVNPKMRTYITPNAKVKINVFNNKRAYKK